MKVLAWILGVVMTVAVVVFGLQVIASETGEVVVLHTHDGNGEDKVTRLWVVDDGGVQWLRSGGGAGSGWYARLVADPRVEVERAGMQGTYTAAPVPAMTDRVNQLMEAKYGWRDDIVAMLAGSRENGVAVRLTPED